jgi:hypothetical protein
MEPRLSAMEPRLSAMEPRLHLSTRVHPLGLQLAGTPFFVATNVLPFLCAEHMQSELVRALYTDEGLEGLLKETDDVAEKRYCRGFRCWGTFVQCAQDEDACMQFVICFSLLRSRCHVSSVAGERVPTFGLCLIKPWRW